MSAMSWWMYAAWGAFGGLAVELADFYGVIRRTGDWPWKQEGEPPLALWLASILVRLFLGGGLASAFGAASQVSGPAGALSVGVAAPLILEQMGKQVQVPQAR